MECAFTSQVRTECGMCNMLCNVMHDINIQLSLNYASRGKHTLPQYRGHFWPRPETDNMYFID